MSDTNKRVHVSLIETNIAEGAVTKLQVVSTKEIWKYLS